MKKLSCEESWAPKNWCFWTVVLEKTLESPLDCKDIQPVHPQGNQSWIFIGRTDVEAETPNSTWCEEPTHWKRPWCWKKLKAGGERDDRGWDGWMASLTQRTWVWQALGDGEGQGILACCSLWGCKGSNTIEWLNWTELPLWANYLPKIPHLLILSYWELVFNIWILGRHKPSVCSTSTSCFPSLWITEN